MSASSLLTRIFKQRLIRNSVSSQSSLQGSRRDSKLSRNYGNVRLATSDTPGEHTLHVNHRAVPNRKPLDSFVRLLLKKSPKVGPVAEAVAAKRLAIR